MLDSTVWRLEAWNILRIRGASAQFIRNQRRGICVGAPRCVQDGKWTDSEVTPKRARNERGMLYSYRIVEAAQCAPRAVARLPLDAAERMN